jgi:predicted TIM-barrel fold metal-dependent hydrolase
MPYQSFPCCATFEDLPTEMRPVHTCDWLHEPEGENVPAGLFLFDAHVHLFPGKIFEALWRWFDTYGWSIRYRLYAEQVIEFLQKKHVKKFCALHYAHKAGIAREMNRYIASLGQAHKEVVPLATIYPGESDAKEILREAFGPLRLCGVKLHCHVQRMPANDPRLDEVYELCQAAQRTVIIHSGRSPSTPAYGIDTKEICTPSRVEQVLQKYPRLKLIVPHLGLDEFSEYMQLLRKYENLYLDTTMVIGGFFEPKPPAELFPQSASRLLYGTDFPNIPYAWDRELRAALQGQLPPEHQEAFFYQNAERLFTS